jgi:hypothetical protein
LWRRRSGTGWQRELTLLPQAGILFLIPLRDCLSVVESCESSIGWFDSNQSSGSRRRPAEVFCFSPAAIDHSSPASPHSAHAGISGTRGAGCLTIAWRRIPPQGDTQADGIVTINRSGGAGHEAKERVAQERAAKRQGRWKGCSRISIRLSLGPHRRLSINSRH